MTLNRLTCPLAMILTVAIGTSQADPLQTHDQYLRHYENGFYSGLGAEISPEADAEKSERDELSGDKEFAGAPKRYSQLGLDTLKRLDNFQYRRSRRGDKQSIIVRSNAMNSYLLVFNQPIPFRARITGYVDEDLQAGASTICIADDPNYYRGSFKCPHRVEAIYPLKDMEQERAVLKFLRAND